MPNKDLTEKIDLMLSAQSLDECVTEYSELIGEDDLYNAMLESNYNKLIEVFYRYKCEHSGSGKSKALQNVKGRVEDFVHNLVYPYFVREFDSSYVFSELTTTNYRYDLFISNFDQNLSLVIELKVFRATSSNIDEPIDQVIEYLDQGKAEILKRPLDFAVVLVFNSTGSDLTTTKYNFDTINEIMKIQEDARVLICEIKM